MNKENTDAVQRLLPLLNEYKILAFHGEMGAGKTTFIRDLCRALGVEDPVSSPTFAIVNEYRMQAGGEAVYHFDFFRIESPGEAEDLAIDEYFSSGNLCLIEWPEKIANRLPGNTLHVFIEVDPEGLRHFRIG
jgi:tRNA threonylcarbamoyladenosine biosynthesis protein TsaE